jgi:hypothetical protein
MKYRRYLLATVSAVALIGVAQTSTNAAVDNQAVAAEVAGTAGAGLATLAPGPSFMFVLLTHGSYTPESVDRAIREIYTPEVMEAQAAGLPQFLRDIGALDLPPESYDAARTTLMHLLMRAKISDELRQSIVNSSSDLSRAALHSYRLAQLMLPLDNFCDERALDPKLDFDDPDCPPLVTQAIGTSGFPDTDDNNPRPGPYQQ